MFAGFFFDVCREREEEERVEREWRLRRKKDIGLTSIYFYVSLTLHTIQLILFCLFEFDI